MCATSRLVSLDDRAIGLQLIQVEIEHGEIDVTFEASFDGMELGLVADRIGPGSRRLAHLAFRESVSPWQRQRRCRSTAKIFRQPRSATLEIVLDLANPPWPDRLFPALRRHRAQRRTETWIPDRKPATS